MGIAYKRCAAFGNFFLDAVVTDPGSGGPRAACGGPRLYMEFKPDIAVDTDPPVYLVLIS